MASLACPGRFQQEFGAEGNTEVCGAGMEVMWGKQGSSTAPAWGCAAALGLIWDRTGDAEDEEWFVVLCRGLEASELTC